MSDVDSIDIMAIQRTKLLLESLESYLRDFGDFYLLEIERWEFFKWAENSKLKDLNKAPIGSELSMYV